MQTLKEMNGDKGMYVVADAENLPFKDSAFTHVVSSEVLEHIPDDKKAVNEVARIIKKGGDFILTFPHRKFYFSMDDHIRDLFLDAGETLGDRFRSLELC